MPAGNDARLRHGPPSPLMPLNVHVLVTADRDWSEGGSQRDDGEDDDGGGEGEEEKKLTIVVMMVVMARVVVMVVVRVGRRN